MASSAPTTEALGREALRDMDRLLRDKPKKVGHDFHKTVRHLADYRDRIIAQQRATPPDADARRRLARLNAVMTVVVAGQYPLGKLPWPHIEKARDELAHLLKEFGA